MVSADSCAIIGIPQVPVPFSSNQQQDRHPMSHQPQRYDLISQLFHWLVVALLIGLIGTFYLHDLTSESSDLHLSSIKLHISLGLLTFVVVVARIGWSRMVGAPEPLSKWRVINFAGKGFPRSAQSGDPADPHFGLPAGRLQGSGRRVLRAVPDPLADR
jgi:hypothetical protein